MKTLPKPEITSGTMENGAIPELQKQLDKADRLKW